MSTIITRNSATSGSTPSSLVQGELAINVTDGRLFYGSGSGNVVKEFTGSASSGATNTGSLLTTASFSNPNLTFTKGNGSTFNVNLVSLVPTSASFASTASFAPNYVLNSATSSFVTNAQTSSFVLNSQTSSMSVASASFASTASFAPNYVLNSATSSFVTNAQTSSFVQNSQTSSMTVLSASFASTASFAPNYVLNSATSSFVTNAQTSSMSVASASFASTASYYNETDPVFVAKSASLATTGSNTFNGSQTINGDLIVNGTASITFLNVTYESASVIYSSGSNQFGDALNDVQTLWGTVDVKTGPVLVTGSLKVSGGITGSLLGTASYAAQALSSSYASTASNILGGKATHVPYFITDTTLATSSIYQSGSATVIINQDNATPANPEALYVWQPSTSSFNVISGKGNLNNYLQLNIQNTNQGTNASSDVVATADNGNENTNYIDMGINSENYSAGFIGGVNDAYLYSTGRHLHIGNVSNFPVQIFAGGSDVDIHNKLELNPNNQHLMSGSLDVSGSIKAFSFTGSLQGNATSATTSQTSSYSTTLGASLSQPANNQVRLLNSAGGTLSTVTVNNVTSASYADNAATANYATTAGNGGVTQLIAGSGVTLIPPSGLGNVTVIATGTGGITIISGSLVTGSFTNTTSFTFNHNLNTRTPIITVFDSNYNQIIPENIQLVNTASAIITFPTPESGFAIGSTGGTTGTALSSSYALFAEYANTASFYAETDPVYIAQKPTLATTGSNIFKGNQTVTGSLFTTGSNTLIGSTSLTGSLNISGSTIQTGNNTLIGTTTLTGSILINGDIIPEVSSSFDLGSLTNPWRSIYVQSGSISIQSDIPGGIPAVISNANGNVTFTGAGFQLKSGSFVPFEVSSTARTIIRVPDIPANDVGGLSIIGSSSGSYQGVTNAGGLLHLTSNDGQSSRITSDAYGTAANAAYVGRKARGTAATPLPVQSVDVLTRISSIGWTGTDYGFTMSSSLTTAPTSIDVVALENYTTSSFGSRFNFYSVPSSSTIRTLSATIDTTGITIPSISRFFGTASWAENALTASYVRPLTQDVIITGSLKITGSGYINGLPILTSANTSSFLDGFGWYGTFCSTGSQTNPVANISRSMQLETTEHSNGVSVVAGSRITFAHAGVYNIQFSAQLESTAAGDKDVHIWFKKNGSNIARSNTTINVAKQSGDKVVAAWNYVDTVNVNDYIEIMWQANDTTMQLLAATAAGNLPATPSVIVTATQVG